MSAEGSDLPTVRRIAPAMDSDNTVVVGTLKPLSPLRKISGCISLGIAGILIVLFSTDAELTRKGGELSAWRYALMMVLSYVGLIQALMGVQIRGQNLRSYLYWAASILAGITHGLMTIFIHIFFLLAVLQNLHVRITPY